MGSLPGLKVVRSSIHGYGVIATRDFAKGEVVAEVDGVVWHEDDDFDDTFALMLDGGYLFDMVDQTRWINHSCDPNSEVTGEVSNGRSGWARLVALRPIRPGEEITYDYAFPAEIAVPCNCGAAACRGHIVDEEDLPQLRRRLSKRKSPVRRA